MMHGRRGFTLIELLVFVAIFAVVAGVFISILVEIVIVQSQQSASTDVTQQGQYLLQQIQYDVQNARLVDMPLNVATSTLTLREFSPSSDPTTITLVNGIAYLTQGLGGTAQALTSNRVTISNLSFTRYYNLNSALSATGIDSVAYSFTMTASFGIHTYTQIFQSSANVFAPVPQIALIQQAKVEDTNTGVTTFSLAYPGANESGDLLIAVVGTANTVTPSVTDTAGNSWSLVASSTAFGEGASIFASPNASSSLNTVTVTFSSGASDPTLMLFEYRGAATSSPLDAWGAQVQADNATPTSPSVSPTSSVELLFGVNENNGPTTAAASAGTGFTLEASSTSGYTTQLFAEDENQYITGLVSAPWSFPAPVSSTAMIATFK